MLRSLCRLCVLVTGRSTRSSWRTPQTCRGGWMKRRRGKAFYLALEEREQTSWNRGTFPVQTTAVWFGDMSTEWPCAQRQYIKAKHVLYMYSICARCSLEPPSGFNPRGLHTHTKIQLCAFVFPPASCSNWLFSGHMTRAAPFLCILNTSRCASVPSFYSKHNNIKGSKASSPSSWSVKHNTLLIPLFLKKMQQSGIRLHHFLNKAATRNFHSASNCLIIQ